MIDAGRRAAGRLHARRDNAGAGLELPAQQRERFAACGAGVRIPLADAGHVLHEHARRVSGVEQTHAWRRLAARPATPEGSTTTVDNQKIERRRNMPVPACLLLFVRPSEAASVKSRFLTGTIAASFSQTRLTVSKRRRTAKFCKHPLTLTRALGAAEALFRASARLASAFLKIGPRMCGTEIHRGQRLPNGFDGRANIARSFLLRFSETYGAPAATIAVAGDDRTARAFASAGLAALVALPLLLLLSVACRRPDRGPSRDRPRLPSCLARSRRADYRRAASSALLFGSLVGWVLVYALLGEGQFSPVEMTAALVAPIIAAAPAALRPLISWRDKTRSGRPMCFAKRRSSALRASTS